eukprot:243971_1
MSNAMKYSNLFGSINFDMNHRPMDCTPSGKLIRECLKIQNTDTFDTIVENTSEELKQNENIYMTTEKSMDGEKWDDTLKGKDIQINGDSCVTSLNTRVCFRSAFGSKIIGSGVHQWTFKINKVRYCPLWLGIAQADQYVYDIWRIWICMQWIAFIQIRDNGFS